eukprot:TRINITY_DN66880_c3_g1_i2.p1 TRINITY_DN66880_c3_g1~~TRINITY_DN66880_c3_g1_i2.p1  ORF type:complete len:482 (-),score=228.62 TRINITY_DN66880_c3_g1_i2:77-1522(-)
MVKIKDRLAQVRALLKQQQQAEQQAHHSTAAEPDASLSGVAPVRVKLVLVGDPNVGKSCLALSLAGGRQQQQLQQQGGSTVAVDFMVVDAVVDGGLRVKVNVWDMGGREEFADVRCDLYRPANAFEANGCALVFDLTSRSSFEHLEEWEAEVKRFNGDANAAHDEVAMKFVVIGNKFDRPRQVAEKEARAWAQQRGYAYFETSATTDHNVAEAVNFIVNALAYASLQLRFIKLSGGVPKSNSNASFQSSSSNTSLSGNNNGSEAKSNTADAASSSASSSSSTTTTLVEEKLPKDMSIRELKASLRRLAVQHDDCITKQDLIDKLTAAQAEHAKRQAARNAVDEERKREKIRERVLIEVAEWAQGRDIKDMLNVIHGSATLKRSSTLNDVNKMYKRALLKIHPDKHDQSDFEAHCRATETFKAVNDAFQAFKDRLNKRSSTSSKRGSTSSFTSSGSAGANPYSTPSYARARNAKRSSTSRRK